MNKNRVTYEDVPFDHDNGQVTHYNVTMAGYDMSKPTTIVLENSAKNEGPPVQFIERPVAEGISKSAEIPITSIGVFSERDHGRYDLIRFEERTRDPQTNEPVYAQRRDHGDLFTKDQVEKHVNKYSEEMEKKQLAEESKKNQKDFEQAEMKAPQVPEQEVQRLEQEQEQRRSR